MTNSPEPSHFPPSSRDEPWWWRLETADGSVTGESPRFPNQGDAESWLGEEWRDLREHQVDQVTLLEEGREVYGPMSLHS